MALPVYTLLLLLLLSVLLHGTLGLENDRKDIVEARYRDRYYDIYEYWWPWFSDITTVIFINLKIWIAIVAMNVFGDGYYWPKWKSYEPPPIVMNKDTWGSSIEYSKPFWKPWGRRKRAIEEVDHMAEAIFSELGVKDDSCRRRIVCHLDWAAREVPEVWLAVRKLGYDVFQAYRGEPVGTESECRSKYQCQVLDRRNLPRYPQVLSEEQWRWPRR